MVNVGLRAYIWSQKSEDAKRSREARTHLTHPLQHNPTPTQQFWNLHDITYTGFRGFCEFIKDDGFPELYMPSPSPAPLHPSASTLATAPSHASMPAPTDDASDQLSIRSSHSSLSQLSALPHHAAPGSCFATARHLLDLDTVAVGVLRFSHSGPPRIAMGMANGMVKVAALTDAGTNIVQELHGHNDAVTDVDWSSDDLLLLTAGADGTAVVWNVDAGQAVRVLSLGKDVRCSFLPTTLAMEMNGGCHHLSVESVCQLLLLIMSGSARGCMHVHA